MAVLCLTRVPHLERDSGGGGPLQQRLPLRGPEPAGKQARRRGAGHYASKHLGLRAVPSWQSSLRRSRSCRRGAGRQGGPAAIVCPRSRQRLSACTIRCADIGRSVPGTACVCVGGCGVVVRGWGGVGGVGGVLLNHQSQPTCAVSGENLRASRKHAWCRRAYPVCCVCCACCARPSPGTCRASRRRAAEAPPAAPAPPGSGPPASVTPAPRRRNIVFAEAIASAAAQSTSVPRCLRSLRGGGGGEGGGDACFAVS